MGIFESVLDVILMRTYFHIVRHLHQFHVLTAVLVLVYRGLAVGPVQVAFHI